MRSKIKGFPVSTQSGTDLPAGHASGGILSCPAKKVRKEAAGGKIPISSPRSPLIKTAQSGLAPLRIPRCSESCGCMRALRQTLWCIPLISVRHTTIYRLFESQRTLWLHRTKAFPLGGRWHPASHASRMTDEGRIGVLSGETGDF